MPGLALDASNLVLSGHEEAVRRGRAGKNQSISVFLRAGLALKGACAVVAAPGAGFSGAAAKKLGATPRVPGLSREATIERPEGGLKVRHAAGAPNPR